MISRSLLSSNVTSRNVCALHLYSRGRSSHLLQSRPSALGLSSQPPHLFESACRGGRRRLYSSRRPPPRPPLQASAPSIAVLFLLTCGTAIVLARLVPPEIKTAPPPPQPAQTLPAGAGAAAADSSPDPDGPREPDFSNMAAKPGHRGNLTADQEAKLRQFWAVVLKTFGVVDPRTTTTKAASINDSVTANDSDAPAETDAGLLKVVDNKKQRNKKRMSIFGSRRGNNDYDSGSESGAGKSGAGAGGGGGEEDDKYGQTKELQQILAKQTPDSLRAAFWAMVKADHPDALLLRFLRARKWDVDKALAMLVSTMHWRASEMHVDDDVVKHGEAGSLDDSRLTGAADAATKKEGLDFLAQLRLGKSFLHGTDKEGRPLCFVRARLHKGGEQSERSMERYTVYIIETARLVLRTPVETACIVFDMSHFTLANMDYAPVKFMIKVFEANYPESLGVILVHRAPWVFDAIWRIIRGWLDPVVASKVHFTKSVDDLEQYIAKSQIIKELGGSEDWTYEYVEPAAGENDAMTLEAPRVALEQQRAADVDEFQRKTFDWMLAATAASAAAASSSAPSAAASASEGGASSSSADAIKQARDAVAGRLRDNYWQLDPYIRARTLYDRIGMIQKDGTVNFYPAAAAAAATTVTANDANASVNGNGGVAAAAAAAEQTTPAHTSTAADDVD